MSSQCISFYNGGEGVNAYTVVGSFTWAAAVCVKWEDASNQLILLQEVC